MSSLAASRIRIRLKGYDTRMVEDTQQAIVSAVERTGAQICGPVRLPTRIRRTTVVNGPNQWNAKEHFEMRIHKRMIDVEDANPKTVDALQRLDSLPSGVEIEIRVLSA